MTINEIETYLYDQVISKVHYDKEDNKHIIYLSDYEHLNLSNEQFRVLKRICRQKQITLEYTNEKVPFIEDLELFKQYNDIKNKQLLDKDNSKLEEKRIEIRNKIANQNFNAVKILLDRRITGLSQTQDKEDIYQIGYTTLLEFLDAYNIFEEKTFTIAMNKYLIYHIYRKIILFRKNITMYANNTLLELFELKGKDEYQDCSEEILATALNTPIYHIKSLNNLEEMLNPISIDEEIDLLHKGKIEEEESILYNDTFENEILDKMSKDTIFKLIQTLPKSEMEVLLLYFGFVNNRSYDSSTIAKMYGLTKSRICEIKNQGINNLRLTIRSNYIRNLYDSNSLTGEILPTEKEQKNLEDTLVKLILQTEFIKYIEKLTPRKKELISLNYGLKDGKCYTIKSISEILNISITKTYKLKAEILLFLKSQILKECYHIKEPVNISYEDYLDYLMKLYLSKTKTRHK